MYEQGTYFLDEYIAGFKYHDGFRVLSELKPGTPLSMVPEPDNPFDPHAVALYFGGVKLGFIDKGNSPLISQFIFYGHADVFEAFVTKVDPEAEPYKQVKITVRVTDKRE